MKFLLLLSVFMLSGCTPNLTKPLKTERQEYTLPKDAPTATVKNELFYIKLRRSDSATISTYEPRRCSDKSSTELINYRTLFKSVGKEFKPDEPVEVESGKLISFSYSSLGFIRRGGSSRCSVAFTTILERGRTYNLIGGVGFEDPKSPDIETCSLGLVDAVTKVPLPNIDVSCK